MCKLVDRLGDRKVKFNMKKTPLISSLVIGFCLFFFLLNNKIVNNSSYLIFFAIIILAIVVTYMTRYTTSRRQVSREIDAGQDHFKNAYDNYLILFLTLLSFFLIFREFNSNLIIGFIFLGCFILTIIITLYIGPKSGSRYFVKKILNELIELEDKMKKTDLEKAKDLKNKINQIKKLDTKRKKIWIE